MMKKLLFIFFLSSGAGFEAFAQTPKETIIADSFSSVNLLDAPQTATGIVIIDDDELGIIIGPNPSNNYISVASSQNLSDKTFLIVDYLGVIVLRQQLTTNIIDLSHLNSGVYHWVISDNQNQNLGSGILVVER